MKLLHIKRRISLSFVSLIFFPQIVFAQNIDAQKLDIYSKLRDKRCSEMTLAQCNCEAAKEMKAYIDALLDVGLGKDDVFYKVAKKYSLNVILDEQIKNDIAQKLIQETGGKYSQIVANPAGSLDFGTVSKKENKVTQKFTLLNNGNENLVITNVRVSCACVSAALGTDKGKSPFYGVHGAPQGWQVVIEPRQYGEVEVQLDLNHSSLGMGKQRRVVFVSSNDPLNPEVSLKIEIMVTE